MKRPNAILPWMPLFSSKRERRLWFWTLIVLVAIYATLGVVPILVGALRASGLLVPGFILGMVLVAATALTLQVKTRPGWAELGVWLGVAAAYLMIFVRMDNPAERTHLIEYGVVAAFIHEALRERAKNGRRVPLPALLALVATALLGWLDEGIQSLLPNRVYDIVDVGFNALAALMVITARLALTWVRRRFRRPS